MDFFDTQEKIFYDALKARQDTQGIVRYNPEELEKELDIPNSEIDEILNMLYVRGVLIYMTRVNKKTGEILKIVQFIEEEEI